MNLQTILSTTKSIVTLSKLKGYRTYIAFAITIILAGLRTQGYIDETTFKLLETVFAGLGLIALRAGINNQ